MPIFSDLRVIWSIFSPMSRDMLGESIRYLERGCMTRRLENIGEKVRKSYFLGFEVSEYFGQTLPKVLFFNEKLILER